MFQKIVEYLEDNIDESIKLCFDSTDGVTKSENQTYAVMKFTSVAADLQQNEYSAFKDFNISFLPTIESKRNITDLINKFNKDIHSTEFSVEEVPYRFLILFQGEMSVGATIVNNGVKYQEINLSGQLLFTENLVWSNELELILRYNNVDYAFSGVSSYSESLENQLENSLVASSNSVNCSVVGNGANKTININFSIIKTSTAHAKLLKLLSLADTEDPNMIFTLKTSWAGLYTCSIDVKVQLLSLTLIQNSYAVASVNFVQHKELS